MTIRASIRLIVSTAALTAISLAAGAAHGQQSSLKQKADYNRSVASVMGGIALIKGANANTLKTIGDHMEKIVKVEDLKQKLRTQRMANKMKAAENYYAKKKLYETYRKARQITRLSQEKLQEIAHYKVTATLASVKVSASSSGVILWPRLLDRECYGDCRARIELLMSQRTPETSGLGTPNCVQIEGLVNALKGDLRNRVRELNPMDYLAAKRFLDSIAHQARLKVAAPRLDAVASTYR